MIHMHEVSNSYQQSVWSMSVKYVINKCQVSNQQLWSVWSKVWTVWSRTIKCTWSTARKCVIHKYEACDPQIQCRLHCHKYKVSVPSAIKKCDLQVWCEWSTSLCDPQLQSMSHCHKHKVLDPQIHRVWLTSMTCVIYKYKVCDLLVICVIQKYKFYYLQP